MHTGPAIAGVSLWLGVILGGGLTAQEPRPEGHRVAAVDVEHPEACGFVIDAARFRYGPGEIPEEAMSAEAPERVVLFASKLEFLFTGAMPAAQYQLRAVFLSDSAARAVKVTAGEAVLEERLALPFREVLRRTWDLPAAAIADGDLEVTITALAGPNAVVSALEVWSTDPAPLVAPPPLAARLALIAAPEPRLSPRPVSVDGVRRPVQSLDGRWRFSPAPPEDLGVVTAAAASGWKDIEVPGEWAMHGFAVEKDRSAGYFRTFDVPADWAGRRVKLRFDAVHSDCRVWVNGRAAGGHEGGFVPFELDVTEAVNPGENRLAVAVKNESIADVVASATQYAGHPLGGIIRKVALFAVPAVSIAAQVVTARFDAEFANATLDIDVEIANALPADCPVDLRFELTDDQGRRLNRDPASVRLTVGGGQTGSGHLALPVAAPRSWDPEHPRLYVLRTTLEVGGRPEETITQRVGFRQVEVRGHQVFVNGRPIKLRGVCRHETHPLRGRSLTPELCRRDAEVFREANVNYVRTSHYPPSEEFLDACDALGVFVECEAAVCWVQHGANATWQRWRHRDPEFFPHLLRANLENVAANRHHPSIIIWSLGNESFWSPLFAEVLARVKRIDPSRPTSFHDQCWGAYNNGGSTADIAVHHYPGLDGPARCDQSARPVLFGEYCHLQTYNQREIFTDPGVRDAWGPRFAEMYDRMYRHPGCLGGALWSGIDDAFHLPDGRVWGYGFWGVIDGWRRVKPETFHMRKAYSPVRVTARELPAGDGPLRIGVENRYDFTDLAEVAIEWSLGQETGRVTANLAPHDAGEIVVAPRTPRAAGRELRLRFTDPRGFGCEEVVLPVGGPGPAPEAPKALASARVEVETGAEVLAVKGRSFTGEVDRRTGLVRQVAVEGTPVLVGGPELMILPLEGGPCAPQDLAAFGPRNPTGTGWAARSVTGTVGANGEVIVTVVGEYAEASGSFVLTFKPDGAIDLGYDFAVKAAVDPRQVGMVLHLARACDTLSWQRRAEWSAYPVDHIGRPAGEARANPDAATRVLHLKAAPTRPWSRDTTALGTADFRSSKRQVQSAALRTPSGRGLALIGDGSQTVRAFVDGDRIGWLIAAIDAGGGEGFFAPHHAADRRPLAAGARIQATIRLQLTGN